MQKISLKTLQELYRRGEKIAAITAYDASFAHALEEAGIDLLFIGDSLGQLIQGHKTPIPVSLEDVIYHIQCVCRGSRSAFILADLPFLTYTSIEQSLQSAGALIQAGADMVKLEGGSSLIEIVKALTQHGIPVCAHLGKMPQHNLMHARPLNDALLDDALVLQDAGVSLLILVDVDSQLAAQVTSKLSIPTIGIGAGPHCSGQIQLIYNILGISNYLSLPSKHTFTPPPGTLKEILAAYVKAVKKGTFPSG